VRASTLHVGAAAAAASLRAELVDSGRIGEGEFNQAFAVARLTPGTVLLALYAGLGFRLAAWRGAVLALSVGSVLPSVIATAIAAAYVRYSGNPLVTLGMQGARAGALAVFLWAAVHLGRPLLRQHRARSAAFAIVVLAVTLTGQVPPFLTLLVAGAAGGVVFHRNP
jgi:chromate transporter